MKRYFFLNYNPITLTVNAINPVYIIRSSIERNPNLVFCVKHLFTLIENLAYHFSASYQNLTTENMSNLPLTATSMLFSQIPLLHINSRMFHQYACCPACTGNSSPYFQDFYKHISCKIVIDKGPSLIPCFLLMLLEN